MSSAVSSGETQERCWMKHRKARKNLGELCDMEENTGEAEEIMSNNCDETFDGHETVTEFNENHWIFEEFSEGNDCFEEAHSCEIGLERRKRKMITDLQTENIRENLENTDVDRTKHHCNHERNHDDIHKKLFSNTDILSEVDVTRTSLKDDEDKSRHDNGYRPSISQFFRGRNVFITGATGFMGKVLVQKLLHSCPDVGTIYLLMRSKKGEDLTSRLRKMTEIPIFDGIRTSLHKLIPVSGDISQLDLAISAEDAKILVENVSVIFHCAANVRFDEPLKEAVLLNTRGTRELLRLATSMKRLEALVHVSTAFSNSNHAVIEERLYPAPADPDEVISQAEQLSNTEMEKLKPDLLKGLPNTYLFSKALAEHIVYRMGDVLPVAILRPSIVCPSYREPLPGWVDTHYGPMGVLVGASVGILRTVHGDGTKKSDLLPVDLGINALITVAWDTAVNKGQDVPIYNCTTGSELEITWNHFLEFGRQLHEEYPNANAMWYPGGAMHKNLFIHVVYFIFTHLIPAMIVDGILVAVQRKPWLIKLQKKLFLQFLVVDYFLLNEWTFKNSKLRGLIRRQVSSDSCTFNFDASHVDLHEYVKNWVLGTRRYYLKMDDSSIPQSKIHLKRLFWLHCGLQTFLCLISLWVFIVVLRAIGFPLHVTLGFV